MYVYNLFHLRNNESNYFTLMDGTHVNTGGHIINPK